VLPIHSLNKSSPAAPIPRIISLTLSPTNPTRPRRYTTEPTHSYIPPYDTSYPHHHMPPPPPPPLTTTTTTTTKQSSVAAATSVWVGVLHLRKSDLSQPALKPIPSTTITSHDRPVRKGCGKVRGPPPTSTTTSLHTTPHSTTTSTTVPSTWPASYETGTGHCTCPPHHSNRACHVTVTVTRKGKEQQSTA